MTSSGSSSGSPSGGVDLVVVGAGVIGSWTALQARDAGLSVVLLDAWGPGNIRSSSGDETRILRAAYGTDELYARWARSSREAWLALGDRVGELLFTEAGVLWFCHRDDGWEADAERTLRRLDVPVEHLSPAEIADRWPHIVADDLAWALLEPEGGLLAARRGVAAAARAFTAAGGLVTIAAVRPGRRDGDRLLEVEAADGRRFAAGAFVFAAGPWLPELIPAVAAPLVTVTKQDVLYFGPPAGDGRFDAPAMPCWVDFDEEFYGIGAHDGRGLKAAPDSYGSPFEPTSGQRLIDPATVATTRAYLARRFPALADAPLVETRVCQYETTPDAHFVIDRQPGLANVWIAGGGSGHAFKHGPAIGAHVVGRLTGTEGPPADDRFGLGRPRPTAVLGPRTGATLEG